MLQERYPLHTSKQEIYEHIEMYNVIPLLTTPKQLLILLVHNIAPLEALLSLETPHFD